MNFPSVPLGTCTQVVGGFAFQSEDFSEKGIPVIRISDIQEGSVTISHAARIPAEKAGRGLEFQIVAEDILIAMSGATTGKIGIVSKDHEGVYLQNQRVGNFRITNPKKIVGKYLRHCLTSATYQRQIWNLMAGAAQPNISSKQLESIEIPLPPLQEQRRISEVLDRAEALRAKRRAALAQLDTFNQAIFLDIFGDTRHDVRFDAAPLSECAEVVSGIAKGRKLEGRKTVLVPYLRVANVQSGFLDLAEIKTIEALPAEVEELRLIHGDIVLTEGGDFDKLGRGAMWEGNISDCIHQNHIFRVRVDPSVLVPHFLHEYLQTLATRAYFLRCSKRTTNLASINMTQLRALLVPLAPLVLQREFASRVSTLEKLKAAQRVSLAKMDELFASLQYSAFQGEL